ncbi:hypothetical protein N8T08_008256 [Aspergillus melleus]|uniref:Uncharacterized protein n=1 Tax=Aspergillus melleus TaxID=138277 RepID=A0ACC3AWI4_9EURO|nr:hypothetical protein N8T08_008256 [Aspergillus melleus]
MSPIAHEVTVDGHSDPKQRSIDEKAAVSVAAKGETAPSDEDDRNSEDVIIVTGADAAQHLLPLRDDFDSALTFRSIVLASGFACFQAVMNQIYQFKPTLVTIQGTFIVLLSYFVGNAWANLLPRGDKLEARWRGKAVWHTEAVYWSTLPTVKTLQGLHWQQVKNSKPLRWFWYAFTGMSIYEIIPAYIFPWLNSVSIPCLAAQKATGSKAAVLTNLFGGASTNEGLGLFSLSLDWQYIGALIVHCFLFWGKDIRRAYKSAREGRYDDRHHDHMAKHYKETPWWWYAFVLLGSFILGLVVVIKENITLPVWAYVVSLVVGIIIAPFSVILYSRYGNGIATNNLSKMLAGLIIPGKPVGNMYFAAWSHNVISNAVNLSNDLKMGEYLKIPPRTMFLTQMYGTILGGFINYAVMISIVTSNRELLVDGNGNSSWSGASIQAYVSNATSWALSPYLYKIGGRYSLVPIGIAVGAGVVIVHRFFYKLLPRIGSVDVAEINMAQFIQYAGYIPYNQSQTCVIFSWILSGFFIQFFLRNYHPKIFKDYSYLVTGAFDGASLTVLFILSFAVFGAGGKSHPFPSWWGNNVDGNYDWCPVSDS